MSIVAERPTTRIPSGTWSIDPVWSALEFEVKKLGLINVKGRVPGFTGTVHGGEHPSIEGTADVSSIVTFDETRDTHLQSPDFFDVARHPEIRFESASLEADGDDLVVRGDLTIKGITKPVELRGRFLGTGTDLLGSDRIALELSGTVDRTDFGLNWNLPLPSGDFLLPSQVTVKASLAAVRAA